MLLALVVLQTLRALTAIPGLDGHVAPAPELLPACAPEVLRCAAVRLWIAPAGDDQPFDDLAFLTTQLTEANREHGRAKLGFHVVEVRTLGADAADIADRDDRDRLGHDRWQRGLIDVFVVSRLANVDDPGDIRGVHWRSRADRRRRWVILSRISPPRVLAHELGHYFGLPHSDVPASLMNTGPRAAPERTFQPDELRRIERRAKALFADGTVTDARAPGDRR